MKKNLIFLILCFLLLPITCFALNDYDDAYGNLIEKKNNNELTIYIFHSDICPHCQQELHFLDELKEKYPEINIVGYETNTHPENMNYYNKALKLFNLDINKVPLTIIGKEYYVGFNDTNKLNIEEQIKYHLSVQNDKKFVKNYDIPLIGVVNAVDVSMPIVSIVLGVIDGFNPCAMWVLLFILNILIGINDKKKMRWIGGIFLLSSGLIYFLSLYGISYILKDFNQISIIRNVIGILAIIISIFSIINIIKTFKEKGCKIVNDKKRKKILIRVNNIIKESSFTLAIIGIIVLAISVNMIEFACSLGFPTIFGELIAANNISGITRFMYILLYTLCYMADDIIVYIVAIKTMNLLGVSNKLTKWIKIIAAILMLIMGILLIFAPNIVMFNF